MSKNKDELKALMRAKSPKAKRLGTDPFANKSLGGLDLDRKSVV